MANSEIRVGTSGWCYEHWVDRFYPKGVSASEWLRFYAQMFDTVELNATFYRLPEASAFRKWAEHVPNSFLFAVKASNYLTHRKRLSSPVEPIKRLITRASKLGSTLGPFLFQLPPTMKRNDERLLQFLAALPRGYQHVIEFRDTSWYARPVLDALRQYGAALCVHDMKGSEAPIEITAPFVYIRLHGPGIPLRSSYTQRVLRLWADRILQLRETADQVYVYFNNDARASAVKNALMLKGMLDRDRLGQALAV